MRFYRAVIAATFLLVAGCGGSGSDDPTAAVASGDIGPNEVNRFHLEFVGGIDLDHTGGLICAVDNGELLLSFSIDASDGEYEYVAGFPGFDAAEERFDGELKLTTRDGRESRGSVVLTFAYGPAPDEYPGVVRAAGEIGGGSITGPAGAAEVNGAYACFLMDAEVGG